MTPAWPERQQCPAVNAGLVQLVDLMEDVPEEMLLDAWAAQDDSDGTLAGDHVALAELVQDWAGEADGDLDLDAEAHAERHGGEAVNLDAAGEAAGAELALADGADLAHAIVPVPLPAQQPSACRLRKVWKVGLRQVLESHARELRPADQPLGDGHIPSVSQRMKYS